ncbi:MAG TPA: diguanylate cyclase, partial [Rhodopila sp.]
AAGCWSSTPPPRAIRATQQYQRLTPSLANAALAHLPQPIAVIDAHLRVLYWNESAAALFGVPPIVAAETPSLAELLSAVASLPPQQQDRITIFVTAQIEAERRGEPSGLLRVPLGRGNRLSLQLRGLDARRWMLVIDTAAANGAEPRTAAESEACIDPLTGLSNRRHLNEVLRDTVKYATAGSCHALLVIDLDRFQPVNDTFGRAAGDAVLCLVAKRLRREAREADLLARLGGDAFAILIPEGGQAEALAARVVESLSRPFLVDGQVANIGASVGIARFPHQGATAEDLTRQANLALDDAKSAGGRVWRVFEPENSARAVAPPPPPGLSDQPQDCRL